MGQPSARQLALIAFAGNLVLCGVVGGSLLVLRSSDDSADATSPKPTAVSSPTSTPSSPKSEPSSSTPSSSAPPSSKPPSVIPSQPGIPQGFQPAAGPGGLTTLIPIGWRAAVRSIGTDTQATDPHQSTSFLRYGGSPAPGRPLLSVMQDAERGFRTRPGYQLLALRATTWRGHEAVNWELEFDTPDGRKHVKSIYWRVGGQDYVLYASSLLTNWPRMQTIYQTASAATKP